METLAGWIAPIATIIAAMMTAANLGARITGWGFVVFTVGSVCWSIVGSGSGQTNLLASNGFLTLVNAIGIWRWLGRQRRYEDGGKAAEHASRRATGPALFTATGIAGLPVTDGAGKSLGTAVEALIECATGTVNYIVVASGGVGGVAEHLRAVPRDLVSFAGDRLCVNLPEPTFTRLPELPDGDWPARAEAPRSAA